MRKCKYLIDISPYDPLCDHPCRLYGGGAVEAECETCQFRIEDLEAENAKLRELCKDMMAFVEVDDACERCGHDAECVEAADGELVLPYEGQCLMLDLFADRMRELGVETDV